jgi:Glyoxalase-like domain
VENGLRRFQIVIDAKEPARLAKFWCQALGYVVEPPPEQFSSWTDFYTKIGVPKEDFTEGPDSIVDPDGNGPRIWFHVVPESKISKNRLHIDIGVSGGYGVPMKLRKELVEAEAARLLKIGATRLETLEQEGLEHYAVAMADPEDNEFDIN